MRDAATLNERSPPYSNLDFGTFNMFLLADRRFLQYCEGAKSSRGSRDHRCEVYRRLLGQSCTVSYIIWVASGGLLAYVVEFV